MNDEITTDKKAKDDLLNILNGGDKKMNKFEQFKVFFDELTTNKIIFELKEVNCNELLNNYVYCVVKIKIIPYHLEFNYRFTLPFKFDKLTSKIKEDIINRIKIDINEFIVKRIRWW